jgi:hypothetical protein
MGWFLHVLLRSADAPGVESTSQATARTEWRQWRKCIKTWSWNRLGQRRRFRTNEAISPFMLAATAVDVTIEAVPSQIRQPNKVFVAEGVQNRTLSQPPEK